MTIPADTTCLLGWMPHVFRSPGLSTWERDFAASIVRRHKREPGFVPNSKQVRIMTRLVDQLLSDAFAGQGSVTERSRSTSSPARSAAASDR